MDMEVLVLRSIETLLLPPGLMLMMMAFGALLMSRFYALGKILVLSGFVLLFAASLPSVAQFNMNLLETAPPLTEKVIRNNKAQAIIVLDGGRHAAQPEYDTDVVSTATLARLRYAAYLHKKTGLPILVTGGTPYGETISGAELMKKTLQQEFGIKARWGEHKARSTWENGTYSREILNKENIQHAYLVTQAWHMNRAYQTFVHDKLEITPAPTGYTAITKGTPVILNWLPDARALHLHRIFVREMLGRIWYQLRYSA